MARCHGRQRGLAGSRRRAWRRRVMARSGRWDGSGDGRGEAASHGTRAAYGVAQFGVPLALRMLRHAMWLGRYWMGWAGMLPYWACVRDGPA
ncbi:hypothetical protein E2562_000231 [Oryza meyeriana var. granulata]|uniref:Uncharacterized protein n=1 Tax=Oryza meyeriana var. granulata TaxID=110450 RepID=A0A6G1CMQ0_9ORYZ|nr:hypothetical protein E2562_000231 [Oryza meyeriana var. granulata]